MVYYVFYTGSMCYLKCHITCSGYITTSFPYIQWYVTTSFRYSAVHSQSWKLMLPLYSASKRLIQQHIKTRAAELKNWVQRYPDSGPEFDSKTVYHNTHDLLIKATGIEEGNIELINVWEGRGGQQDVRSYGKICNVLCNMLNNTLYHLQC